MERMGSFVVFYPLSPTYLPKALKRREALVSWRSRSTPRLGSASPELKAMLLAFEELKKGHGTWPS